MKSKKKDLYKKKVVRIQIGKENSILAFVSYMNMGLCPIIKIVHHTLLENI